MCAWNLCTTNHHDNVNNNHDNIDHCDNDEGNASHMQRTDWVSVLLWTVSRSGSLCIRSLYSWVTGYGRH